MKPLMTRWKTVPAYSEPSPFAPVLGSFHSPLPSARPTKFCTVFGAWSGNSCTRIGPRLVVRVANREVATGLPSRSASQVVERDRARCRSHGPTVLPHRAGGGPGLVAAPAAGQAGSTATVAGLAGPPGAARRPRGTDETPGPAWMTDELSTPTTPAGAGARRGAELGGQVGTQVGAALGAATEQASRARRARRQRCWPRLRDPARGRCCTGCRGRAGAWCGRRRRARGRAGGGPRAGLHRPRRVPGAPSPAPLAVGPRRRQWPARRPGRAPATRARRVVGQDAPGALEPEQLRAVVDPRPSPGLGRAPALRPVPVRCRGGDGGTRTPNPRLAKAVLCQLSYAPGAAVRRCGVSAGRG